MILNLLLISAAIFGLIFSIIWATICASSWGLITSLGIASCSLFLVSFLFKTSHLISFKILAISTFSTSLLILSWFFLTIPSGTPSPDSPISQRFSTGETFPRFHYANLVPEIEQMNLGLHLIGRFDSLMTPARVARLSKLTIDFYHEMDQDPNFRELGSAMGGAYAEIIGSSYPSGHYYLFSPPTTSPKPLPAILFLHGSAGNFKVYSWIWSKLAEELNCVIIAPSFGYGNWNRSAGVECVVAALKDAQKVVKIDPQRIHLAGLSNGGLGVCGVTEAHPQTFAGVILISPVMDESLSTNSHYHKKIAKLPFLVLTGENDERVPFEYVQNHTTCLKKGGVSLQLITYPEEDHFLFFSKREEILQQIKRWIQAHPRAKN